MPIRLLRRLAVYTPVLVLTLESFCRVICGAPFQPMSPATTEAAAPMCAAGTPSSSSCQRCPNAPSKSAPTRPGCSLALEELGQPAAADASAVRSQQAALAAGARADSGYPLLRRLAAFRRLEVHAASPPLQLLLVTFRN
ncbi:MAG: hypothetical protein ABIT01_07925 [Thermoanaerobaculia bacterium]